MRILWSQFDPQVGQIPDLVMTLLHEIMQPTMGRHLRVVEKTVVIQSLLQTINRKDMEPWRHNLPGKLVNAIEYRPFFNVLVLVPVDHLEAEAFAAATDFVTQRGG